MNATYVNSPIPLGPLDETIGTSLLRRGAEWAGRPAFAYRPESGGDYRPVAWQTCLEHVASVAAFLSERGIEPGERVAVFSPNSYPMLVWELAVTSMGAVSVPIFAGYGADQVHFILGHADPKVIYVSGRDRMGLVESAPTRGRLQAVVGDGGDDGAAFTFDELLRRGEVEELATRAQAVSPHDPCFIQYTSGTTGHPKGVVLTHRNIVSQQVALGRLWTIEQPARFLSYLPWHHSFGGLFERFTGLMSGATIHLDDSRGKDLPRLLENWRLVKPTHFFSVPKVYLSLVTEAKIDREVHRAIFHPELCFVFTAAAPLPQECGAYFQAQRIPVLEGWGLTETSPCVTLTPPETDRVPGLVGDPIPGCEIAVDAEGEILVRGPNVMQGYYRDSERTASAIDQYGWLHTGDLGEITDRGLRIVCRRDGLFKLSNGEKVSSMLVENALTLTARWIQNAVAVGAGELFVGALIFPNFRAIRTCGEEQGKSWATARELASDPEVSALIREEATANMAEFAPKYMVVRRVAVVPRELSLAEGELTPSMKVVRYRATENYGDWADAIFRPEARKELRPFVVSLMEEDNDLS